MGDGTADWNSSYNVDLGVSKSIPTIERSTVPGQSGVGIVGDTGATVQETANLEAVLEGVGVGIAVRDVAGNSGIAFDSVGDAEEISMCSCGVTHGASALWYYTYVRSARADSGRDLPY